MKRVPRLLLVTGMSGAGKSTVLDALEDMGWDCVENLPTALLADFEQRRRPGSDALQQAAIRSTEWYETVRTRLHLDPVAFAYDYLTRTGRVSHDDVKLRDPALAAAFERDHPERIAR